MQIRIAALTVIPIVLAATTPTRAGQIVSFGFTGTVDELLLDRGLFGPPGGVSIGDPFSGSFSYEVGAGNPDQDPGDPNIGRYALGDFTVDGSAVTLGTMSIVVQIVEPIPGPVPDPGVPGGDRITLIIDAPIYPRGIALFLWAPYQTVLANDSLPIDIDLGDFTDRAFLAGLGFGAVVPDTPLNDIGALATLSPVDAAALSEPSTLGAWALGLAILRLARRRPRHPALRAA